MLSLAAAVLTHELAHMSVLFLLKGKMKSFRPAPFGFCMEFDESSVSLKGEALVSVAGCAVNIFSFVLSFVLYRFFSVDILDFGVSSLFLALLNMIPAEPLDGGRLLRLAILARTDADVACRISAVVTYVFGFLLFLFASYALLTSASGIYPLMFSLYIMVGNAKTLEKTFL